MTQAVAVAAAPPAPISAQIPCDLIVAGISVLSQQGMGDGRQGLRPLSNWEVSLILELIATDPSLQKFHGTIITAIKEGNELAKAVMTPGTPEAQFYVAYMKWLAYRQEKPKLPSAEENARLGRLEPALQHTNLMEMMDLLVIRLTRQGHRIPQPITKLLFELLQGGIERIQVAANTFMLNGQISEIVKTLEFLQTGEADEVDDKSLYVGIMKLWALDGGAAVPVQKTLLEFTPGERRFFTELDPDSPLTLPSRHFSKQDVDAIRAANRGIPLSQLTEDQVFRPVAKNLKWLFPTEKLEAIAAHYPGKTFLQLGVAEIDAVLEQEGQETLMDKAVRLHAGFRVIWPKDSAPSLQAPKRVGENTTPPASALVPTVNTHPVALSITAPGELEGYGNVASQITHLKSATPRLESAIAKIDPHSPGYLGALEVYRTYLNMAMYAPHTLANSDGLYDVLAVASVEVGSPKDQSDVLLFFHRRYQRIRDLIWRSNYHQPDCPSFNGVLGDFRGFRSVIC